MFDELAHPTLGDTTSTKDLYRILCSLLSRLRRIHLQERNLSKKTSYEYPMRIKEILKRKENDYIPSKFLRLLLVCHVTHLICHILQPRLNTLRARNHTSQFMSYHSLTNQWLSKYLTLSRPSN